MTLVVGSVEDRAVRLTCDSQISDRHAARNNVVPGRLKLVVLRPNTCIGYAGQPDIAIDAIRAARSLTDFDDIAEHLLHTNVESHGRVDFLIAQLNPLRLEKIAQYRRFRGGSLYWIGDPEAVDVFGRLLDVATAPASNYPEYALAARIHTAFLQLLSDTAAPSVGGLSFTVARDREGFRYAPASMVFFPSQSIPSGVPTSLCFGGPAQGGYAYSVYSANAPGVAAAAVYFLQGRCGCLYMPLVQDEAQWFSDVSQDDFKAAVSSAAGAELLGITFD